MVNTTTCLALRELFIIHTRLDVRLQYDMYSAMNKVSQMTVGSLGLLRRKAHHFLVWFSRGMHSAPSEARWQQVEGSLLLQPGALGTQNAGLFWGVRGKPGMTGTIFYLYTKLLNCLGSQGNDLIPAVPCATYRGLF